MPILNPDYISSWYYFRDGDNLIRIFETWSETQEQEVEKVALLQGDIGTHVMNVGGIKWRTSVKSPALIIEGTDGVEAVTDAFDMLVYAFNSVRYPALTGTLGADYVLSNATLKVAQEGVDVDMNFLSSVPGAFAVNYGPASMPDFIGRVARFYDVTFVTSDSSQTYSYQVLSATININVTISENYYINTGSQAPFFGIQGYHVSGEIELAVPPAFFDDVFIPPQNSVGGANNAFQALNANNSNISLLLTGRQNGLILGSTQLRSKVARSLNPRDISRVTVSFESFTRYSTLALGA